MKKTIVALLSLVSLSAHACNIFHTADTKVSTQFSKLGAWSTDKGLSEEKYISVCKKLQQANAEVQINATGAVLSNMSIGWASLSVKDRKLGIATSSFASLSTQVNTYASQDKADELMVSAINQALQNWDQLDKALEKLDQERARIKAASRAR